MKTFVSWSGGKDSALACYRVMKEGKMKVTYLLNMLTEKGEYSRSHGLSVALLQEQASAMGIPMLQRRASWDDYEKQFKLAIADLKRQGIQAGIFGDIDLQPHRDWVERVCRETGVEAFLPLWNGKREDLLEEFISAGFKSRIVVTDSAVLGEEWLGCEIDQSFKKKVNTLAPQVDLCGEKGEFHTFVYDGPMFKAPVLFHEEERLLIEKHWVLKLGLGVRQEVQK